MMNSDKEYKEYLRKRIAGKSKEEAIKELENIMFLLEQDNYLDRPSWYACKELVEELEDGNYNDVE